MKIPSTRRLATFASILATAGLIGQADAATFSFNIAGPTVSGAMTLTYGTGTDAKYPNAFQLTNVSGSFTDLAIGVSGATVRGLVPLNRMAPENGNTLAPNDFSHYDVAAGLEHGFISYDNLYWPGGSPQTANSYPASGGPFDIYGLLVDIGGGMSLNLWSNGHFATEPVTYGVAVVTRDLALDYVDGVSVVAVPEPGTYALFGAGLLALVAVRRRAGTGDA